MAKPVFPGVEELSGRSWRIFSRWKGVQI